MKAREEDTVQPPISSLWAPLRGELEELARSLAGPAGDVACSRGGTETLRSARAAARDAGVAACDRMLSALDADLDGRIAAFEKSWRESQRKVALLVDSVAQTLARDPRDARLPRLAEEGLPAIRFQWSQALRRERLDRLERARVAALWRSILEGLLPRLDAFRGGPAAAEAEELKRRLLWLEPFQFAVGEAGAEAEARGRLPSLVASLLRRSRSGVRALISQDRVDSSQALERSVAEAALVGRRGKELEARQEALLARVAELSEALERSRRESASWRQRVPPLEDELARTRESLEGLQRRLPELERAKSQAESLGLRVPALEAELRGLSASASALEAAEAEAGRLRQRVDALEVRLAQRAGEPAPPPRESAPPAARAEPPASPPPSPQDGLDAPFLFRALDGFGRLLAGAARELESADRGSAARERAQAALAPIEELRDAAHVLALLAEPAWKRDPVAAGQALREALRRWEPAFRARRILVVREFEARLPARLPHREPFLAALHAILRNAYDAMSRGGKLAVSARLSEDGRLMVSIQDSGPGVTPAVLKALAAGDPPFRPGRIGLGLVVARRLVARLGGRFGVEPGRGGGTLVTFQAGVEGSTHRAAEPR